MILGVFLKAAFIIMATKLLIVNKRTIKALIVSSFPA